jgi:hypothetical protein
MTSLTVRLVVVADAHCEPAGLDDTGAVKGGYLVLRGKVMRYPITAADSNTGGVFKRRTVSIRFCTLLDWDMRVDPLGTVVVDCREPPSPPPAF